MKSIAVTAFRAQCLSLLEAVARTGEPLLVTKRGKPLARVVASGESGGHPQASLAGTVTVVGDLIEPVLPASAWNAMRASQSHRRQRPRKNR